MLDNPLAELLDSCADCLEHSCPALSFERSKNKTPRPKAPTGCNVAPSRFVTVGLASKLTGLSEKAIRKKIEDGKWIAGLEFRRSHNRIFIDLRGYELWVERAAV